MMEKDETKTSVWWDIDNYPVPSDCDAHEIGPSIRRALRSLGYYGPNTITAIGKLTEVPPSVLQALSSTGITFKIVSHSFVRILGRMWLNKGYNILYAYLPECMQDLNFPAECLWQNILADARETRRNEIQEQCSETCECTWFCKTCKFAGVQSFENFITHLKSVQHP